MLSRICKLKTPPDVEAAASHAIQHNPVNAPSQAATLLALVVPDDTWAAHLFPAATPPTPRARIAALATKFWGAAGVDLTVSFPDGATPGLKRTALAYMNLWGKPGRGKPKANIRFRLTNGQGRVRVTFRDGEWGGLWSYVGPDILLIPANEPTLNLEGFTERTPAPEWNRVMPHEAGHTSGFPHEHSREGIIRKLDRAKVIAQVGAEQGWSVEEIMAQILTAIPETDLVPESTPTDEGSVMTYWFPGSMTLDGQPIIGGRGINANDYAFAAKLYPRR